MCLINAFQLYNICNNEDNLSLYNFKLKVIEALLPPKPVIATISQNIHLPQILSSGASGRTKRKQCVNCKKNKKRVDTIYCCPNCPRLPGLCLTCFREYHKY